jgi:hypothetical protein
LPRWRVDGLLHAGDGGQRLVVHLDRERGFMSLVLAQSSYCHDRISHEAHHIRAQGVFILRNGQDAKGSRHILAGQKGKNARHALRGANVDALDPAVRHKASDELKEAHAGERQIVGVLGGAGYLGATVDAAKALADQTQGALFKERLRACRVVRDGLSHGLI